MYLYLAFIGSTCCLTDKECTFLNQILNDKNHFKKINQCLMILETFNLCINT